MSLRSKFGILIVLVLMVLAAALAVPGIQMRAHVIALKATGQIPGLPWADLMEFMKPESGVSLGHLRARRNPHAAIKNPRTGASDVREGASLYAEKCAACHGGDGTGSVATPALAGAQFKHGVSDWALYKTIRYGIPDTAMVPHPIDGALLWQLVSFVRSFNAVGRAIEVTQQQERDDITVPYDEIRSILHPSNDWLTYSGSYTANRNSSLKQINKANVAQLGLKWIHEFQGKYNRVEVSPIVRNEVMFITVPPDRVVALDSNSGKVIWKFQHQAPAEARGGYAGKMSRGSAILDGKVFFATSDARVIALSASTGLKVWNSDVKEDLKYSITGAPLAYKDLVVTGITTKSGGASAGRGAIVAYDANTGAERWRFNSVPGPDEAGNETWAGNSWADGGASTWLTGSYDVENDILYWGVGNPKPDYIKSARKGDNLYSNSVVALRGSTGELVWYFQFTPGDDHDWDSAQIPVLAERVSGEEVQKVLLWANRNGFYYILDRITGQFISATPFVHQTWADRIDANGRPVLNVENAHGPDGVMVFPGNKGGTNWWSPSYDPSLGLMYVGALEKGMVFFPGADTNVPPISAGPFYTAVRALDAFSGELVWEYRHDTRHADSTTGGLLSTQGGVLFGSDMSKFFALDSKTGEELWSVNTGGKISASPVTFSRNGKQLVVIAAGGNLLTFGLPE